MRQPDVSTQTTSAEAHMIYNSLGLCGLCPDWFIERVMDIKRRKGTLSELFSPPVNEVTDVN